MKVYIAGKITDDPNYREKFADAQTRLEAMGHIVLNPAWLPQGLTEADYMRIDFAMIDSADAVCLLPDWVNSPGARLENNYCLRTGKKVYILTDRK